MLREAATRVYAMSSEMPVKEEMKRIGRRQDCNILAEEQSQILLDFPSSTRSRSRKRV